MATLDRYGNPMTRAGFARGGRQHNPQDNGGQGIGWRGYAVGFALFAVGLGVTLVTWRLEQMFPF